MVKTYETVAITALKPRLFEYVRRVEAGEIIYIIKNSVIVAKLERVDFSGKINEVAKKRGIVI